MKLQKYIFICVIVFLIVFSCLVPSSANPKPDKLIVVFAQWPPWKIIDKDQFDGIDARIIRNLAKRTGFFIQFYECPWPRCVDMLKNGEADLITSFRKTVNREAYAYYLGAPYWVENLAFWVKENSNSTITNYEDLYDRRIGTTKGSAHFQKFDQDALLNKTRVISEQQLFKMLLNDRIDTFIGYETVIDYLILTEGFKGRFKKVSFKMPGSGSYIAMSKKSKALAWMPDIISAIQEMAESGDVKKIINSFLLDIANTPSSKE